MSKSYVTVTVFVLFLVGQWCRAQKNAADAESKIVNKSNTISIQATTNLKNVGDCITVEAVLLAHEPAAKLFSGWVAKNYAVVKTTISNHCDNEQFILHDIFFDYSDWALSGVFPSLMRQNTCPAPPVPNMQAAQPKPTDNSPQQPAGAAALDNGKSSFSEANQPEASAENASRACEEKNT